MALKIEFEGTYLAMSIYDLPQDVIGIVVTHPFCELRRTCKWFQELTRGMFTLVRENDTTVVSSARYSYSLPKLHQCVARPVLLSRSRSRKIWWDDLYQQLCNYILIPQWSCDHDLVIVCEDDELRGFAPIFGCSIYKLWKVTTKNIIDGGIYDERPVGFTQRGGALVVASVEQCDRWICTWYMQVHICDLAAAIRVSHGPVCVYIEVPPARN